MARYADTDKLKNDILTKYKKHWEVPCSSEDRLIQSVVTDLRVLIEKNTIDDVAPRAEVERDLHDLLNYIRLNEDISKKCIEENGEENREYFKGKLSAFLQIRGFIDVELKKKYTQ